MKACTAAQMREIDRRAAAEFGMPSLLLMENAGRAVAERALARLEQAASVRCVRILCGHGNNGGDGFVAARHLFNRGIPVEVLLAGEREKLRGDARTNFELLAPLGVPVRDFEPAAPVEADLLIDALLGTGFAGEPRGGVGSAIAAINAAGVPVLAVDVPSGLNADTGQGSEPCVRATETVTFGLPKLGLITYPGRELSGELTVAHISLPRPLLAGPALQAEWLTASSMRALWPARSHSAHKGDAGRVLVVAGSPGMTGAATLTCDAALRAGAGLVTLAVPRSLNPILEVKLTEAMTLPVPETEGGAHSPASLEVLKPRIASVDVLAAGPGLGRDPRTRELLCGLLQDCPVPVVLDADGLNLLAPAGEQTFPERCVVTPHPGEMARLLGTPIGDVQSNRLETACKAARRFGCVVLLKGPATVIAAPDGRLAVNASGGPALATGGAGDVLTGILAAALARGLEPFQAACAAAFLHGVAGELAGERFGAPGTVAGDVVHSIPAALRRLQTGEIPDPYRIV